MGFQYLFQTVPDKDAVGCHEPPTPHATASYDASSRTMVLECYHMICKYAAFRLVTKCLDTAGSRSPG
jgi:hypothetical protein